MRKLLLLAFLPLLFINCSSDDDITSVQNPNPTPTEKVSIVGTWKSVDFGVIVEGTNLSAEAKEAIIEDMDPAEQKYIIFNSDGTGMYKDSLDDDQDDIPFIYSIKGNVLKVNNADEPDEEPEIFTFESSKNQLNLNNSMLEFYQDQDDYRESGLTRADYVYTYEKL